MTVNLKRIRAFTLVAEKQSFSETAEIMALTQPAVSQQIKTLEEELGISLLDRSTPGVQLTHAGKIVYQAGKQMLRMWEDLEEQMNALHGTLVGTLHIGASTIPGNYLLPKWLSKFCQEHPKVDIHLDIRDSRTILHQLKNRQVDICVVGCLNHQDPLMISKALMGDTLCLVVPNHYPTPPEPTVEWLLSQPLLLREEGSGTRQAFAQSMREQGYELNRFHVVAQLGSTEAILSGVESDLGVALVSQLAAVPAKKAGRIRIIPFQPAIKRSFCLSFLKSRENQPIISAFSQAVMRYVEERDATEG